MVESKSVQLIDGIVLSTMNDYIGSIIEKSKNYYEYELLSNFIDYIPANSIIYDVGANIGNHTVFFSKYLKPRKIYTFEPETTVYKLLIANIDRNNLKDIETYNFAIGEKDGVGTLSIDEKNMGASKVSITEEGQVVIKSLDSLDIELPDFVKIDVEGFELDVLLGMKEILTNKKPIMWIEIFDDNKKAVDEFLRKYHYVLVDRWLDNYIYLPVAEEHYISLFELIKNKAMARFNSEINRLTLLMRNKNELINNLQKKIHELEKRPSLDSDKETIYDLFFGKMEQVIEKENDTVKRFNDILDHYVKQITDLEKEKLDLKQIIEQMKIEKNDLIFRLENGEYEIMSSHNMMSNNHRERDAILSNLSLINREEEIVRKLEDQIIKTERIQDENEKLKLELANFRKENQQITKSYNALKNSTLGKLTLKYWEFRNRQK